MLYKQNGLTIYFGNATDQLYHPNYKLCDTSSLLSRPGITHVQELALKDLLFLDQTHSDTGYAVSRDKPMQLFAHEGDYSITQEKHYGLGVMTADCLPVACFDPVSQSIGIAHAGWRGAVQNIVPHMIENMSMQYGAQVKDIQIFFGPSAGVCCYQVGPEFQEHVAPFSYGAKTIHEKDGRLFFDLPQLVHHQLADFGIQAAQIKIKYNLCTICSDDFYSHRRFTQDGNVGISGRQMTIVSLNL